MKKIKKNMCLYIISLLMLILATGCTNSTNKYSTENPSTVKVTEKPGDGFLFPAPVKNQGGKKWGYINSQGTFAIEPEFDSAKDFQENDLAIITISSKEGLINKKGEVVLKPTFDYINDFSEGFAIGHLEKKSQIIDSKGAIVFSADYYIGDFKNGFAVINKEMGTDGFNYGYIDKNFKVVGEPSYKSAGNFSNNKALVQISENKYEIIDNNFKTITTFNHNYMYDLSEDRISFKDGPDGKFGSINSEGKVIIPPTAESPISYKDGLAIVESADVNYFRKAGVIDKDGKYVIKDSYSSIQYVGNKFFAATKLNKSYGSPYFAPKCLLDANGKQLTDFKYFEITMMADNIFLVADDMSTYFIDNTGKTIDNMPKFTGNCSVNFTNNLIKASIDQRIGYLTKGGKVIWQENSSTALNDGLSLELLRYSPNRSLSIVYPELKGLKAVDIQTKINDGLKKEFLGDSKTSEKLEDGSYANVTTKDFEGSQNKDLLVVLMTGYAMPNGAAHGMPMKVYYHIDLKTGAFYKLPDLFKNNSNYLSKLSAILKAQMEKMNKEDGRMFTADNFTLRPENQGFYLTKDALNIYFTPYEIASYAEGFPSFAIPYSEIKSIINTEGDFYKAFDKSDITVVSEPVAVDKDSIVDTAIDNYEKNIINAINSNDFALVEATLIKDSNLYKSQKNLLPTLNKQGIKEKLTGYSITKIQWNEDKTKCLVNVDETISIKYPEKAYSDKKFSYVYTLTYDENHNLLLKDIGKP